MHYTLNMIKVLLLVATVGAVIYVWKYHKAAVLKLVAKVRALFHL